MTRTPLETALWSMQLSPDAWKVGTKLEAKLAELGYQIVPIPEHTSPKPGLHDGHHKDCSVCEAMP